MQWYMTERNGANCEMYVSDHPDSRELMDKISIWRKPLSILPNGFLRYEIKKINIDAMSLALESLGATRVEANIVFA